MALCNINDRFEKNTFIVPISIDDVQVRLQTTLGEIRHTITPSEVAVSYVHGNFLKIKTITDLHTLCFESHQEALEALLLFQNAVQTVLEQITTQIYLPLTGGTMLGEILAEDISFKEQVVVFGPVLNYTRPDIIAGDPLPASGVVVPGVVELNRGYIFQQYTAGGLFNEITEAEYILGSPGDTEWNSKFVDNALFGHSNITNLADRNYDTWEAALDYSAGLNIVGLEMVMHVISTDQYFFFVFNTWSGGGGGAGFSYTAYEVSITEPKRKLTFSDGTYVDTAHKDFLSLIDSPSTYAGYSDFYVKVNATGDGLEFGEVNAAWSVLNIAFVSPQTGNDSTAVVGDGNMPFQSIAAAQNAANYITLLPGTYSGTHTLANGKNYNCMIGVIFPSNSKVRDGGTTINFKMTGKAVFNSFSYGFEFTGTGTVANIELDSFDNVRTVCFTSAPNQDIIIKCRSILTNCNNGGAYACRIYNDSKIYIEAYEKCYSYHWFVSAAGPSTTYAEFTLKCPDIRILSLSTYGNAYKALINDQGNTPVIWTVEGDFKNESLVQTSAFGVTESGIVTLVLISDTEVEPIFNLKGTFDCGNMFGLLIYYGVSKTTINFENGFLRSNTNAFSVMSTSSNNSNITFNAKNMKFEGSLYNEFGNGVKAYFENCSFYTEDTRILDYKTSAPASSQTEVYFYNCMAETLIPGGSLINDTGGVMTVGTINTKHNGPLGIGVTDTWNGFEEISTFKVPKIS